MSSTTVASEAQDVNDVIGDQVRISSELVNDLAKTLEGTDPVDDIFALDILVANARRIAELANEVKIHRLSYKHVSMERSSPWPEWQQLIDSKHFIEGIKSLRAKYNYDLMTAKNIAEAYMGRRYAWKQNT